MWCIGLVAPQHVGSSRLWMETMCPALAGGFFTTEPPGKPRMPSNHLILCHPLLLPPSIFPSIRVFSNESILHIRWPKYWSFSFSIIPSNEYSGLISFRIDFHPYEDPDPALENSEWPPTRFCQLLWVISGVRGRVMTQHSPLPPNPFHALSPPGPRDAVLSMWAPPTPSVSPAAL